LPAVGAGFATFFTLVATFNCNFFHIQTSLDLDGGLRIIDGNETTTGIEGVGVGLWSIEDIIADKNGDSECTKYPASFHVDGALKFARMMGALGSVLAIALFVMILIPSCVNVDKIRYLKPLAGSYFCMAIVTILLLVRCKSCRFFLCSPRVCSRSYSRLPFFPCRKGGHGF
jgi:hypothetical protein